MELFVPSLIVLILGAIVFFIVLPRFSPYTLGVLSLALCILGIWQHYKTFPYEYRSYLVTSALQDYAPFIMLGALILGAMIMTGLSFGGSPPSASSVLPNISSLSRPANNKGSIFNLGGTKRNNLASTSFMTV